jgi:hypothetical protein
MVACGAAPSPLRGQEVEVPAIRGFVEPVATLTGLADRTPLLLGGRAGLRFPSGFVLRGGGHALVRPLELPGAPSSFELTFGYGGVGVEVTTARGRAEPSFALLLGAGHGEVRSRFTGAELASENVLVLEPEGGIRLRLHAALAVGATAGYRWVSALEKLPGISSGGLRGWTLSFSARLQQRP